MNRLPFHYGWLIIVACILTTFSCFGLARFAVAMLVPGMQESLSLSYEQMGYLGTANFVGYLLAVAVTLMLASAGRDGELAIPRRSLKTIGQAEQAHKAMSGHFRGWRRNVGRFVREKRGDLPSRRRRRESEPL